MPRTTVPVAGKAILITGAARGIGAESARRLAARGARVALAGLEPEQLERVAADCPQSVWFETDVTDAGELERAVEGTVEAFGGIDVVVANAGIGNAAMIRTIDPAAFERTLEVNVLGSWRTVRAALPHVIERRGYVLQIASMMALVALPGMAAYAASKSAVEAFANALRIEVAHLGVGVGVGYFSWIDTDLVRGADRHEVGGRMRKLSPPPFDRTYPVADAAEAIASGIERRARVVCCPRWLPAAIALRSLLQPLAERDLRGRVAEFDRDFERLAAERGAEASAPVGAGGEADRRRAAATT